jgi:hypothetical protein
MVNPEDFFDEPPQADGGSVEVTGPVWRWQSKSGTAVAAWFFLSINGASAEAIRPRSMARGRGFGSLRVTAEIGQSIWQTSIFPNREDGGYLLPLKAEIRRREGIEEGQEVTVLLRR